ncbi:MAG TPA: kelch repeat-containing protein, partial [Sandaracinaceae bacterium LLY-WYZ-13_1]|nr:kelch repeat-containing protein [Sandaracinaceae bacterium LLY-WYZ-13_1]
SYLADLESGPVLTSTTLGAPLYLPAATVDAGEDRAILAWGSDGSMPSEAIYALDLETLETTTLSASGATPRAGTSGFLEADPYDGSRWVAWPGSPLGAGQVRFDLYGVDRSTLTIEPIHVVGVQTPPATLGAMASRDSDALFVVAGETLGGMSDQAWRFDLTERRWVRLTTSADAVTGGSPSPRRDVGVAPRISGADGFTFVGGRDAGGGPAGVTAWSFRPADATSAEWVEHTLDAASSEPDARRGASMFRAGCFGTGAGLFGGLGEPTYRDETWLLECPSGMVRGCTWTQVAPSPAPAARAFATSATSDTGTRVVTFGGFDSGGVFGDVWTLDPCASTPSWSDATPTSAGPVARWGHAMVIQDGGGGGAGVARWLVFGGYTTVGTTDPTRDVWALIDESGTFRWEEVSVAAGPGATAPTPRGQAAVTFDSRTLAGRRVDRLFVYGGGSETRIFGDLWELHFPAP